MAIGAIEALQHYGYNTGDNRRYIPVVGVDGIPEARELIEKGTMEGTVVQDTNAMAEDIYKIGINYVSDIEPLTGVEGFLDESRVAIRIPYPTYIVRTKK